MRLRPVALGGALLAIALLTGCAGAPAASPTPTRTTGGEPALTGEVAVYAAASLTAGFTELATAFESAHPGVTVTPTFNGSGILLTQLEQGAPADVFASADEATMTKLEGAGLSASDPVVFATNTLEIATPPGNPARIRSFADLAKPGVRTVVCQAAQPCGAATAAMEKVTGVDITPISEAPSVSAVLLAVENGADAGLVYRTDVRGAAGKVEGVAFDEADRVVNRYPITVVKGAPNAAAAKAFVAFVSGTQGRKVLRAAGFGTP